MSTTVGTSAQPHPQLQLQQRRFAPLNADVKNDSGAPELKGIVFDVDGTLWYVF